MLQALLILLYLPNLPPTLPVSRVAAVVRTDVRVAAKVARQSAHPYDQKRNRNLLNDPWTILLPQNIQLRSSSTGAKQ